MGRDRTSLTRTAAAVACTAALTLAAGPAGAANWFELNAWLSGPKYSGRVPACDTGFALGLIQARFSEKESRFWRSNLFIAGFENIRETAYLPWAPHTIPRRFCSATALISDGIPRPVHYSIGENTGLAGAIWGVEWCVVGLDRNWAYNPGCRMARP